MTQDNPVDKTEKVAAQNQHFSKTEIRQLISRNVLISIAAKIFYLFSRFFLPPIILAFITLEEYGIWATCFILISYLGMGAFGVSNVYIRYVAEYHAKGETEKINHLLSTGVTVVSILSLILLILLWFCLPLIIEAFSVSPALHSTAFIMIFGTACIFMLDLSWGAFAYVLNGLQRIVEQNVVWMVTFTLEAVLIVLLLLAGLGIYALLYAFVIRYLVAIIANVILCYRAIAGLSLSIQYFDWQYVRLFYHYGAIVQISGILGMFLRSIEKLIAGIFINVQATGLFDVGEKFPVMATSIAGGMNAAYLPATAYLHSQDRRDEIAGLYLKGARYVNIVTGFIMGFLAAFSLLLITAWLGTDPQYAQAPLILSCFTLPFQLNVLTGPASAFFRGCGEPAKELWYPVSQLLLVMLFVGLGFYWYGITVLIITLTVAAAMILSVLGYLAYANRYLGISQHQFWGQVMMPGLLPYLLGFAVLLITLPWLPAALANRWYAAALIGVAGILYSIVTLLLIYRLVCDPNERAYIRTRLMKIFGLARRVLT